MMSYAMREGICKIMETTMGNKRMLEANKKRYAFGKLTLDVKKLVAEPPMIEPIPKAASANP